MTRRDDLVATITAHTNRLGQTRDPWLRREAGDLVRVLKAHLARVDRQVEALVAASEPLAAQSRRLRTVPGVGPVVAATLLARLPELGHLTRQQIASLAGLAPLAQDSGRHRGKRRIWGGRADVRRSLYLAAFIASRCNPTMRAFRAHLQTAGKPTKLALTACARKLLTTLNAMLRNSTDYQPSLG